MLYTQIQKHALFFSYCITLTLTLCTLIQYLSPNSPEMIYFWRLQLSYVNSLYIGINFISFSYKGPFTSTLKRVFSHLIILTILQHFFMQFSPLSITDIGASLLIIGTFTYHLIALKKNHQSKSESSPLGMLLFGLSIMISISLIYCQNTGKYTTSIMLNCFQIVMVLLFYKGILLRSGTIWQRLYSRYFLLLSGLMCLPSRLLSNNVNILLVSLWSFIFILQLAVSIILLYLLRKKQY